MEPIATETWSFDDVIYRASRGPLLHLMVDRLFCKVEGVRRASIEISTAGARLYERR